MQLDTDDVRELFEALFQIRADTQEILALLREADDEAQDDEP